MSAETGLAETVLSALEEFDTPTVCNVIELWNLRPRNTGYMNKSIRACFPKFPPMVGYASTATFRSMGPPRGGDAYAGLNAVVEQFDPLPGPPIVVYQDLDDPTAAATFGEVMCTTFQAFGAKGLITSGTGRDLDEVEALGFPVFTNGTVCAHGYCHFVSVGTPVTVGGIVIYPGDLLHGDLNGVTTIPHEIAAEIPEACKEFKVAEDLVLNYLKAGNVTAPGLTEARNECTQAIEKLGERLRG
jgi:regulator of RNase E activity RraA